ncbi:MAG: hypothetical protein K0Q91_766 [Fibrobacteria bacterium]|jgi:hypothetical protein|nr:hypothetical protein [Fibrobacteria bacterium]
MATDLKAFPGALRRRIEVQGFTGFSDEDLLELDPWLRFTPFLSGLISVLSTFMGAYYLLFGLAVFFLLGAAFPRHPFDVFYNGFIRSLENSPRLPVSPVRRRIVYGILAVLSFIAALCFITGHRSWGTSLGWLLSGYLALMAAQQICMISEALHKVCGARRAHNP